ncbi:hypothetical protein BXY39_1604 [Eilatimonas milleporae]|uniref:Uncharacterized protein n=1 Tax=Eilatimonas milleporae TaxID=911205 RepID=A0A3M0CJK1_9PROT|nr:hypothetical protein BXY39_1604 [Eilatimonas milleporae]
MDTLAQKPFPTLDGGHHCYSFEPHGYHSRARNPLSFEGDNGMSASIRTTTKHETPPLCRLALGSKCLTPAAHGKNIS